MNLKITQELKDKISQALDNISDEDLEKYFPEDTRPKGWLSIEDYLPPMLAIDISKGATAYRIKRKDGSIGETFVSDHNIWYYEAKQEGITHWFNE